MAVKRRFCILWWPGQINKPHIQRKPNGITGTKWYFLKSWNLPIESLMLSNMVVSFPLELDGPINWDPIPLIPSYCNCTPCKNCVIFFGGGAGEAGWIWNGWIYTPYHPNQQGKPSADTWGLYGKFKTSAVTRTPSWILLKGSPEHSNSIQCCLHLAAG